VENQNRKIVGYVDELKQMIFPPGYVMGVTKKSAAKRKAESATSPGSAKKNKVDEDVDVEAAAKSNLLSKLTVPMLKDYCRDKKLRASGTKKQDFIDAIQSHLGIAQ